MLTDDVGKKCLNTSEEECHSTRVWEARNASQYMGGGCGAELCALSRDRCWPEPSQRTLQGPMSTARQQGRASPLIQQRCQITTYIFLTFKGSFLARSQFALGLWMRGKEVGRGFSFWFSLFTLIVLMSTLGVVSFSAEILQYIFS